ncbi:hypothetical protein KRM28CT15_06910 [Krasilnikovia sp. M28-CT-15]
MSARGSCLLVAASTSAAQGQVDHARDLLREAASIDLGTTNPSTIAGFTSFTQWNVLMHQVAVEVEAGSPGAALAFAKPLSGVAIGNRERMSYLWVDIGRALLQLDRYSESVDAFRRAERAAPLRISLSPIVRNSLRELLARNPRSVNGSSLRGLAERCGALSDT